MRAALVAARVTVASAATLCTAHEAAAQGLVFNLPGLGQTSFTFTNTTLATYRATNFDTNPYDEQVLALTERFDSAFTAAPWRLQIRFDAFGPLLLPAGDYGPFGQAIRASSPAQCSTASGCDYLRGDFRLERLLLRYQRGIVTADLGDYYAVVGRGVALAFRKLDPLGIDTTLRGARAQLDFGRVFVHGFGGYANPQNLDPLTLAVHHDCGDNIAIQNDTHRSPSLLCAGPSATGGESVRPGPDVIGGAEAAVRIGPDEDVEVGAYALHAHFPNSLLRDSDTDLFGYRVSAPALLDGALALHGEAVALRRNSNSFRVGNDGAMGAHLRTAETTGRALYASAQFTAGDWSGLFEWKDYTNYLLSPDGTGADATRIYSAAPSLERDDVQLRTNSNTRGGRLRVEHAFRPGPWSAGVTGLVQGIGETNSVDPWGAEGLGVAHGYLTVRRRGRPAPVRTVPSGAEGASAAGAPGSGGGAVASGPTGGIGGTTRVATGDWVLTGSLGFRYEFLFGRDATGGYVRNAGQADWTVLHGDVDVAIAINQDHSFEFKIDGRYETRFSNTAVPTDLGAMPGYYTYVRAGVAGTWSFKDFLQVSGLVRYDTFFASQGRTLGAGAGTGAVAFPVVYPAGEVRWMFRPGSTLRLFAGMTPGGRLCTGGVCRDVPPFEGAVLELVLRI